MRLDLILFMRKLRMNKVNVRELFNTDRLNIWNIEDTLYEVTYEDNVTLTERKKDIIFNRFCFEYFTLYPYTKIPSKLSVLNIIGNGYYDADTHIKTLENIFKYICEENGLHYYYQKESLLKMTNKIINMIFNELINRISSDCSTIDATDFIGLIREEGISKIHANLRPTPESVDRAYKEIKQYITTTKTPNRFVKAYRSKAINENQANQCIGPRGFVSDLLRTVYKQPIMNGFIKGMGSLFEIVAESQTAAKSLNANDTHIKTSEYASRRIQLLTMSVTGVDINDCGSTEYMDIFITKDVLDNIKGKYYLKEEGVLDYIRGNETNLINTIIKIRTSLGCKSPDPAKICTKCLGKVSENFKENSNLGYTMTAFLMEKMTQTILSTKHLTHSVRKSLIKLEGNSNKYFYTNEENNIYFNEDIDLKGLYLILPNNRLNKLVDVLNLPHTNIALNKIGELETIMIKDTKHKTPVQETVDISYRDRQSIITKPLLEYIKATTLESDSRGNFVIPLDNFNKELPIFNNPLKETNIISFVNKIASMIETNKDKVSNPYEKLLSIFNTVIDQVRCNISVIEVIVYATTTYNAFNGNYRHGRNSVHPRSEGKTILFRHRSISQLLIFEETMSEILKNPTIIFSNKYRQAHPADVLFTPSSIVKK